jgi:hypothetical protein
MSYETQGRQEHGWFGHGTAPKTSADDQKDGQSGALFDPANQNVRFAAIAHAAIASLPAGLRTRSAARFDQKRLAQFTRLMTDLAAGKAPDIAVNDAALGKLRQAAELAGNAATQKELAQASSLVADAMQEVGLDRWAGALANTSAATASVKNIQLAELQPPNTATDAGTPPPVGYVDPDPKQ